MPEGMFRPPRPGKSSREAQGGDPAPREALRTLLRGGELAPDDFSRDEALTFLLSSARELTGAAHAAIAVLTPARTQQRLLHDGPDADGFEQVAAARMQSDGLLAVIADDLVPLRLPGPDDARSPDWCTSMLGVPIPAHGRVFGVLYLLDAAGGAFTAEHEKLVAALALAAGGTVNYARVFEESRLRQRWLQASAQIGTTLHNAPDDDPLVPIARCAHEVGDADLVTIGMLNANHSALVIEAAYGLGAEGMLGARYEFSGGPFTEPVLDGTSRVFDAAAVGEHAYGPLIDTFTPGPTMQLPLVGTEEVRGTITVIRRAGRPALTDTDLEMALGFAAYASIALELSYSRTAEHRLIVLEDRDRIAMDLHDHVIQELFAIGLGLESTATGLGFDDPIAERLVGRVDDLDRVIKRIRSSIFELRGSRTSQDGLHQMVRAIGVELRSALGFAPKVSFSGALGGQVEAELRDDVEACVRESLTNVAKHAHATAAAVAVTVAAGSLAVRITDDGVGPGELTRSSGTANLRARADKRGGSYSVEPGADGGTVVTWRVPVSQD